MNILHVSPSYLPAVRYGGPIYSVHGLCRSLAALGHNVHVYTTNVDGGKDSDVPLGEVVDIDGVKVWYFPSKRLRRLYYAPQMRIALQANLTDFDIVHLHSVYLWPGWAAARIARQSSVPYIISPRGMLVKELVQRKSRWIKTAWLKFIEKGNIEHASALHVTSSRERDALKDFSFDYPEIINIPNGVESPGEYDSKSISEDIADILKPPFYVLYFGRINWEKGLERLIRAWPDISEVPLVIAGNDEEGYEKTLRSMAKSLDISDRVRFIVRPIDGQDKEALLQNAGIFVLPSYSENFGNTVLEAMIRGVPVVTAQGVGASQVVLRAKAGLVVDGGGGELSSAVKELINDVGRRKTMSNNGRREAQKNYSWEVVAERMYVAYDKIVNQSARS